jgi:hypothetical protein
MLGWTENGADCLRLRQYLVLIQFSLNSQLHILLQQEGI